MLGCEDLELSSVGHPAEASALSLVLPRPAVLSTEVIGFLPVASSMRRKGRSTSVPPALSREHSRPTTDSNRSPKTKEPRLSEEWRSPADNWLIDEGEGTDPTQGERATGAPGWWAIGEGTGHSGADSRPCSDCSDDVGGNSCSGGGGDGDGGGCGGGGGGGGGSNGGGDRSLDALEASSHCMQVCDAPITALPESMRLCEAPGQRLVKADAEADVSKACEAPLPNEAVNEAAAAAAALSSGSTSLALTRAVSGSNGDTDTATPRGHSSMALRRATLEEVMTVLSIYVRGKYAESIAQRMLRVIGAKIHLRMDTLSDEQVHSRWARTRSDGLSSTPILSDDQSDWPLMASHGLSWPTDGL